MKPITGHPVPQKKSMTAVKGSLTIKAMALAGVEKKTHKSLTNPKIIKPIKKHMGDENKRQHENTDWIQVSGGTSGPQ